MRGRERGFVAVEWVAAIALLLLPVVVLVATLPGWAERRGAATTAAEAAAALLAREWPAPDRDAAVELARSVARDHGVAADDVEVRMVSAGETRGSTVRVEVTVAMPAIAVGGIRGAGWHYTAVGVRRIDDYRSR